MEKTNKINARQLSIIIGLVLLMIGCKKIEPIHYIGESAIFFSNAGIKNTAWSDFSDTLTVSFFNDPRFQRDTVDLSDPKFESGRLFSANIQFAGNLWVYLSDRVSSNDRPFEVSLSGSGLKTCIVPSSDQWFIPADSVRAILDLKFVRPPLTDTSTYLLKVSLKDNQQFKGTLHEHSSFVYRFGNIPVRPLYWDEAFAGKFSFNKALAMAAAFREASELELDPLKNIYLPLLKEIPPTLFSEASVDDIYNMINLMSKTGSTTKRNIYRMAIKITQDYLARKASMGTPVSEADGTAIVFPNS
ncbi:DUF4843 domain-containing protein [Sphingobacterium sp. JUb21]|uniref:DUF4843 domain-containing protein n=2 Tax=unclassified Sphingobacterium TaxID=2609468 RepID=UPI0010EAC48E|nr:DUF4843 domain-containing protein [Sphingobacterium sp. JUb21]TCQ99847.1 uncharacterized protein DUF4843 [Sphingobacterium sp. JUb20]